MLAIRLKRLGTKQRPFYRVVVSDSRKCPTGRAVEEIGTYDPRQNPPLIKVNLEAANNWIGKGARPSDTVRSILRKAQ